MGVTFLAVGEGSNGHENLKKKRRSPKLLNYSYRYWYELVPSNIYT
jgi:hypothetical protein